MGGKIIRSGSERISKDFLETELKQGKYLVGLQSTGSTYCAGIDKRHLLDQLVRYKSKDSNFGRSYLCFILTIGKSEKFVLNDLAIDGFVNVNNDKAFRALSQKEHTCKGII